MRTDATVPWSTGALVGRISDVAILTRDLDRAIAFYEGVLGFELEHRMPGFADFAAPGVRLALWDLEHMSSHIGLEGPGAPTSDRTVMIAVRLASPAEIDAAHAALLQAGVSIASPPADYPWNARALYFAGPDTEIWELYAWHHGGEPGHV